MNFTREYTTLLPDAAWIAKGNNPRRISICNINRGYKMNDLKECLHNAVFNADKPAKVIADELGIKYSYLARMVLPGSSGCNFPAKYLMPLMQASYDFNALQFLANKCGFLLVNRPIAEQGDVDPELAFVSSYCKVIEAIANARKQPTGTNKKIIDAHLTAHAEAVEVMRINNAERILQDDKDMPRVPKNVWRKTAV